MIDFEASKQDEDKWDSLLCELASAAKKNGVTLILDDSIDEVFEELTQKMSNKEALSLIFHYIDVSDIETYEINFLCKKIIDDKECEDYFSILCQENCVRNPNLN